MSKVQNNSIQTGYGKQTAGGAAAGHKAEASTRNQSPQNKFEDPFKKISPETQVKFDLEKVSAHGRDLSAKAKERRTQNTPDYSKLNEDGSLPDWKELDKQYSPDNKTAANRENPLEKKAFEDKFSPETTLTAFQKTNEEENKKATKPAKETLVASHSFDKQQSLSGETKGSSTKAIQA